MRVLLTSYQEKTIFLSMVPLAWALRTAGHEVRIACHPSFTEVVTRAGLTAVPVGRAHGTWRQMTVLDPDGTEAGRAGMPSPYDAAVSDPRDLDWQTMKTGYEYVFAAWHRLDNFPLIAGMVEFAREWRPDLVLWEPNTFAGAIAAESCGAAHGRLLWSIDVFGVTREIYRRLNAAQPVANRADPMADWLAGYARRYEYDFSETALTGQFTIDTLPRSLAMRADLTYLPMRYVPYGGGGAVPRWMWEPPRRPRVALTLGTTATERFAGYTFDLQKTLDELGGLDVEVVATLAEPVQRMLTAVPDNVRMVSFMPLHALAETCSVVINHTGPGTFLTTALHGVPQLLVPYDFDEPELARRAGLQGGSLVIAPEKAGGPDIREGVARLLDEPVFRDRAAALADEIRALPDPHALVSQLEALAVR